MRKIILSLLLFVVGCSVESNQETDRVKETINQKQIKIIEHIYSPGYSGSFGVLIEDTVTGNRYIISFGNRITLLAKKDDK